MYFFFAFFFFNLMYLWHLLCFGYMDHMQFDFKFTAMKDDAYHA